MVLFMKDVWLIFVLMEIALMPLLLANLVLWISQKISNKRIEKEAAKYKGRFYKTDSEGVTNPNVFIEITYEKSNGFRFFFIDFAIHFVDLSKGTEKSYRLEIPSEQEKYNGYSVLVVHTLGDSELWIYQKDHDGYVDEIRSWSGDATYKTMN